MSRVQTLYELQMIGTAVFAVTGVLAVNRRGLDALGGTVLGTVTSLGGGTIRDVVIRAPVTSRYSRRKTDIAHVA